MARANLLAAADVCKRHPDRAAALDVDEEESASWRDAAEAVHLPYDDALGVHEQHAGFTRHQRWDFASTRADQYPLMLNFPYFDLYRKQVIKQADLVLAMHTRADWFEECHDEEQIARNFAYYEPLTVRDSSLSACVQAVMAARTGHLELAYAYTAEAALMDLADLEHNTRDGLHIASLAGAWTALVAGFGGMRWDDDGLRFAPGCRPDCAGSPSPWATATGACTWRSPPAAPRTGCAPDPADPPSPRQGADRRRGSPGGGAGAGARPRRSPEQPPHRRPRPR